VMGNEHGAIKPHDNVRVLSFQKILLNVIIKIRLQEISV
jgi:hypothetical protein